MVTPAPIQLRGIVGAMAPAAPRHGQSDHAAGIHPRPTTVPGTSCSRLCCSPPGAFPPGHQWRAGRGQKSTFIEALGLHLIGQGHRVAVLAIDPSSTVSGGSIWATRRAWSSSPSTNAPTSPAPAQRARWAAWPRRRVKPLLVCEAAATTWSLSKPWAWASQRLPWRA